MPRRTIAQARPSRSNLTQEIGPAVVHMQRMRNVIGVPPQARYNGEPP
jgi:hypothetical protein